LVELIHLELIFGIGETPLHIAVRKCNDHISWLLTNRGADIARTDRFGSSPHDIATPKIRSTLNSASPRRIIPPQLSLCASPSVVANPDLSLISTKHQQTMYAKDNDDEILAATSPVSLHGSFDSPQSLAGSTSPKSPTIAYSVSGNYGQPQPKSPVSASSPTSGRFTRVSYSNGLTRLIMSQQ